MSNKLYLQIEGCVRILPLPPKIIVQHVWQQDGVGTWYSFCNITNCQQCKEGKKKLTDRFFAVVSRAHPEDGVRLINVDEELHNKIMEEDCLRFTKGRPWSISGFWRTLMGEQGVASVFDVHRGSDFYLMANNNWHKEWSVPNCNFHEGHSPLGTPEQIRKWMDEGKKMLSLAEPTRNVVATKPAFGCVRQTGGRAERVVDEAHKKTNEILSGFTNIDKAILNGSLQIVTNPVKFCQPPAKISDTDLLKLKEKDRVIIDHPIWHNKIGVIQQVLLGVVSKESEVFVVHFDDEKRSATFTRQYLTRICENSKPLKPGDIAICDGQDVEVIQKDVTNSANWIVCLRSNPWCFIVEEKKLTKLLDAESKSNLQVKNWLNNRNQKVSS